MSLVEPEIPISSKLDIIADGQKTEDRATHIHSSSENLDTGWNRQC